MICDDDVDLARVHGTIAEWGAGGGTVVKILSCVVRRRLSVCFLQRSHNDLLAERRARFWRALEAVLEVRSGHAEICGRRRIVSSISLGSTRTSVPPGGLPASSLSAYCRSWLYAQYKEVSGIPPPN